MWATTPVPNSRTCCSLTGRSSWCYCRFMLCCSATSAQISFACAVFAKSEMVSLMRKGVAKKDILAGLHAAITSRVYALLKRVEVQGDFVMTGGIAKNIGIVKRVAERVGMNILIPSEPQIAGALGAAIFAKERLNGAR